MATYPKISENEMNYFQYKAKQLLLLKKEDQEWKEYCEEVAPGCTACAAEKIDVQNSKDAGIQVSPKKPFNVTNRPSLQLKHQKNELPEALNNIRMKLENIDLALTKMYETSHENKKEVETQLAYSNVPLNAQSLKLFEEQRKLLIRNSLKASLEKVNKKVSVPIQKINSGYFLPHDLQMKRAASRKAYIASLQTSQTKPKVLLHSVKKNSGKTVQTSEKKKAISKPVTKSRKVITKSKVQKVNAGEEATLIKTIETGEVKDDNIEYAVDGILDDLLGEAVLDLNKIRLTRKNMPYFLNHKKNEGKDKEKYMLLNLLTSSPKKDIPKMPENGDSTHVKKLISFLEPSERFQKISENVNKESENCHEFTHLTQNSKQIFEESEKNSIKVDQPKKSHEIKVLPKFVCGLSHIVSMDPIAASEISFQRDTFWKYLKDISRTIKGNFNPWTFCNVLAESILDDCIQDVSDELANVPTTLIKDLYNEEFVQQVEFHSTK